MIVLLIKLSETRRILSPRSKKGSTTRGRYRGIIGGLPLLIHANLQNFQKWTKTRRKNWTKMIVLLIQLSEKRRVLSPIWHACSTIRFLCREIIWGFPAPYPWWSNLKILFFIKFWLEPKNFFMTMGSLPIAQFRPRKNLKTFGKVRNKRH